MGNGLGPGDLAETRRAQFRQLIAELGGFERASLIFESSRGKLSRLANAGQQNSRAISDNEARKFERLAGKSHGWLDNAVIADETLHSPGTEEEINLQLEEDIPPRAGGIRMKEYGEKLFLEAWSHRLRINAIRHLGLDSIVNVSIWRSGWLSAMARGRISSEKAAAVVTLLRTMLEAVSEMNEQSRNSEIVLFPSDTVVVGAANRQEATYLIDPKPAPPQSIHAWVNQRQFQKSERFGDLVAVFQTSVWGDGTIRCAFSGFPLVQDSRDATEKLCQLCEFISGNVNVLLSRRRAD